MDMHVASLTNRLLHSKSQLEETNPTQAVESEAVEAEGDPEAAAAEGEAVVIPEDRWLLPQFRLCRNLLWQAAVLHRQVIQPTPALLTNAGEPGQTVGLYLGKHPGVHGRLAYAKLRLTHHSPRASKETHFMKSDIITPKLMHAKI